MFTSVLERMRSGDRLFLFPFQTERERESKEKKEKEERGRGREAIQQQSSNELEVGNCGSDLRKFFLFFLVLI